MVVDILTLNLIFLFMELVITQLLPTLHKKMACLKDDIAILSRLVLSYSHMLTYISHTSHMHFKLLHILSIECLLPL